MRTLRNHAFALPAVRISCWITCAALAVPVFGQPRIDGDHPGVSAGAGAEYVATGNPLDRGDTVYSLWAAYRSAPGAWGLDASVAYAHPTSSFARSLGGSARLGMLDLSVVRYLNYPAEIDRSCGGKQAAAGYIQPWHCGRRLKKEPFVFAGPGLAVLRINDAFPNQPITDAVKDYFTINFGFGFRLYRLQIAESEELAPGLSYQPGYRKSRWYLRPEIRGRWFTGGSEEIDWSVGLGIGYCFDKGSTHGALCMQAEESCHLAQRVAEMRREMAAAGDETADEYGKDLEDRRAQLRDYQVLIREAGADCGRCIEDSTAMVNRALTEIRRLPSSGAPD